MKFINQLYTWTIKYSDPTIKMTSVRVLQIYLVCMILAVFAAAAQGMRAEINTALDAGHSYYNTVPYSSGIYTITVDIQVTNTLAILLIIPESEFVKYAAGELDYKVYYELVSDSWGKIARTIPQANYAEQFRFVLRSTNLLERAYAKGYIDFEPFVVTASSSVGYIIAWIAIITIPVIFICMVTCCIIRMRDACKRKKHIKIQYAPVPAMEMQPIPSPLVTVTTTSQVQQPIVL